MGATLLVTFQIPKLSRKNAIGAQDLTCYKYRGAGCPLVVTEGTAHPSPRPIQSLGPLQALGTANYLTVLDGREQPEKIF